MQTRRGLVLFVGVLAAVSLCVAQSKKAPAQPGAAKPAHTVLKPEDLKWGPLIPGAEMAVVAGTPSKAGGMYIIRIKCKDGLKVMPHWHPTDEHITVMTGIFAMGIGDKYEAGKLHDVAPGSHAAVPKEMHHFALSKGESIIEVSGMAPFVVNWVNPADDPANQAKAPAKKK